MYPESIIEDIANIDANANVDNPERPCPTVQPIAITPPMPMNAPPIILFFNLLVLILEVQPNENFLLIFYVKN